MRTRRRSAGSDAGLAHPTAVASRQYISPAASSVVNPCSLRQVRRRVRAGKAARCNDSSSASIRCDVRHFEVEELRIMNAPDLLRQVIEAGLEQRPELLQQRFGAWPRSRACAAQCPFSLNSSRSSTDSPSVSASSADRLTVRCRAQQHVDQLVAQDAERRFCAPTARRNRPHATTRRRVLPARRLRPHRHHGAVAARSAAGRAAVARDKRDRRRRTA